MIHLFFVGDGDLDSATVPPLVSRLLGVDVRVVDARPWPRLSARGYAKKLRYAATQAEVGRAEGLVATVDGDRDGCRDRLGKLRRERSELAREGSCYPIAIGCANPHAEAWLLDDSQAVRRGMSLVAETTIPRVTAVDYPKRALEALHAQSPRAADPRREVWADIARGVNRGRCPCAVETGFADFADDMSDSLHAIFD